MFLFAGAQTSFADNATSTPGATDQSQSPQNDGAATSNTLVVHKPLIDPSWGKVVQYQEEQSPSTHETLYKFLFQDSNGTVRTAIYHENASGNGYWEVWAWDLP